MQHYESKIAIIIEGGSLKFNLDQSNFGECTDADKCLCVCPKTAKFELKSSGRCILHIQTITTCNTAAKALGLPDTTARQDKQRKVAVDPPGCYLGIINTGIRVESIIGVVYCHHYHNRAWPPQVQPRSK